MQLKEQRNKKRVSDKSPSGQQPLETKAPQKAPRKAPRDKSSLDKSSSKQKPPGQKHLETKVPWTKASRDKSPLKEKQQ